MKYRFTEKEIELMKRLHIPFDFTSDLSEEEELQLLDIVDDYLLTRCMTDTGVTKEGEVCEDILDDMAEQAQ